MAALLQRVGCRTQKRSPWPYLVVGGEEGAAGAGVGAQRADGGVGLDERQKGAQLGHAGDHGGDGDASADGGAGQERRQQHLRPGSGSGAGLGLST